MPELLDVDSRPLYIRADDDYHKLVKNVGTNTVSYGVTSALGSTLSIGSLVNLTTGGRYFAASSGTSRLYVEITSASSGTTTVSATDTLDVVGDYGAVGDGVTDDTAAFRLAAADMADGVKKIRVPRGIYLVDTTAGAIFDQPVNKSFCLEGDGPGNVGSAGQISQDHGTRIVRSAGTNPILQVTGTASNARGHGKVVGIEFNGNDLNGPVVTTSGCNEMLFDDIRIANCAQKGWTHTQLWNSRFRDCFTYDCGSGTTHPAMTIGSVAVGDSLDASQTLSFVGCQWEQNTGTDVKILGTATSNCSNITFTACKWERQIASQTYPVVSVDYAGKIYFTSGSMSAGGTDTTSYLVDMGTHMSTSESVGLANMHLAANPQSGSNPDYYIYVASGLLTVTGCSLVDTPTISYVYAASGVGLEAVKMYGNVYAAPGNLITDARSGGPAQNFYWHPPFRGFTGTAAYGEVGTVPWGTYDLLNATTSGVYFSGRIPTFIKSTTTHELALTFTSTVSANNVRFQVSFAGAANGTDLTASAAAMGGAVISSTQTAPTAGQSVLAIITLTGFTPSPGGLYLLQVERIGGDAADTNTGTVQIISVDVLAAGRGVW